MQKFESGYCKNCLYDQKNGPYLRISQPIYPALGYLRIGTYLIGDKERLRRDISYRAFTCRTHKGTDRPRQKNLGKQVLFYSFNKYSVWFRVQTFSRGGIMLMA